MPYRRLPKTDQTRLKALQAAVNSASEADFGQQVIPYHLLTEAQRLLSLLSFFEPICCKCVPGNSLLREFLGGSTFHY